MLCLFVSTPGCGRFTLARPSHAERTLVYRRYSAGDLVCGKCGLVIGDRVVDVRSEWRTFGNDDNKKNNFDPSRVGDAQDSLLDGSELSTSVGTLKGGLEVPWAKWASRSAQSKSNARKIKAFQIISQLASRMELSQRVVVGLVAG